MKPDALDLQDRLDDLMDGYKFWRDQKLALGELTVLDEVFIRWVEHIERGAS